ncbi:ABC-type xylose transport system substrate-binding protein [Rubellimicrobium aerolatum]|nr:ABC-type xylose transport system substrate-binding protein [Rubellimicrobium aerolatum]
MTLALLATMTLAGSMAVAQDAPKVFMLLPNETTIRFESRDAPFFTVAMSELAPEAEVIVQNAQGDPARQQAQVEDAIAQGAAVIVLTSADANLVAGGLAAAEAHVVFDSLAVGRA